MSYIIATPLFWSAKLRSGKDYCIKTPVFTEKAAHSLIEAVFRYGSLAKVRILPMPGEADESIAVEVAYFGKRCSLVAIVR